MSMSPGQASKSQRGSWGGMGLVASAAASRQSDLKIKIPIDLTTVWALLDHEVKKGLFFASCD